MGRLSDRLRASSPRTRAVVMSLLLPGLGQAYLGRLGRAVIWIVGIVLVGATLGQRNGPSWSSAVFAGALGVLSAIDAAIVAPARREPGP
mgnify:FL=1